MIRNRSLFLLALLATLGATACGEDVAVDDGDPAGMGAGQPQGVEFSPPEDLVDIALPRDSALVTGNDTAGLAAQDTTSGQMR